MIRRPPRSTRTDTLFPTRRSSDLFLGLARPGFRVVDYLVPFAHPRGRHAIVHVGKLAVVIWLRPDEVDACGNVFRFGQKRPPALPVPRDPAKHGVGIASEPDGNVRLLQRFRLECDRKSTRLNSS